MECCFILQDVKMIDNMMNENITITDATME